MSSRLTFLMLRNSFFVAASENGVIRTPSFGAFHCLMDNVQARLVLYNAGSSMAAVDVMLAVEQRGGQVKQGGGNGGQYSGRP